MERRDESIRERLLAHLPRPESTEAYREEVVSALERNEKRLRIEKWGMAVMWLYACGFFMVCLYLGPKRLETPAGHQLLLFSFLMLIGGAIEILKHAVNRSRVELLKEVKQLQLQVLELQASLKTGEKAE